MSGNTAGHSTSPRNFIANKKLRKLDADGDSTMHSSPEMGAEDDMFPEESNVPSTPRNAASFALDPTSELSPPNSQGPPQVIHEDSHSAALSGSPSLNANGKRVLAPTTNAAGESLHSDPETGYQWSRQEDQPGYEWKNSRAREEELRAWEFIADKASMIKLRYGDPLDATVPAKRPR